MRRRHPGTEESNLREIQNKRNLKNRNGKQLRQPYIYDCAFTSVLRSKLKLCEGECVDWPLTAYTKINNPMTSELPLTSTFSSSFFAAAVVTFEWEQSRHIRYDTNALLVPSPRSNSPPRQTEMGSIKLSLYIYLINSISTPS